MKKDLTVNDFLYREREVVRSLGSLVLQNIARHHIDLIHGQASFEDQHIVRVRRAGDEDLLLRGDVILIATGSLPSRPRNIPFGDPRLYDSDSILRMERMPRSLAVVGAGVIGCEYTTIFAALGLDVTLIDGRNRLLAFLDGELSDRLRQHMEALNVDVRLREDIKHLEPRPDAVHITLGSGATVDVDCVLLAAGRLGKTRLPDLASSYMRLYSRLGEASSDVEGETPDLAAATAVCPVGLPLEEVATVVRRLSSR